MGHRLTGAKLGFTGEVDGANVTGSLSGDGALDGLVMRLAGDLAVIGDEAQPDRARRRHRAEPPDGEVSQTGTAPVDGRLTLDAPDIAPIATLALVDARARSMPTSTLSASDPGQGVALAATATDLAVAGDRIGASTPRRPSPTRSACR